jgi:glycosyltransferase involved in cell wall biosynthesis
MKLLVVTAAFPPMKAPEGDHAFHLCQHLADHGLDVHVITSRGTAAPQHPRIKVDSIVREWSWRDLLPIIRSIRRQAPDGVLLFYIGWLYNAHPMITFLPTIVKRMFPGIPVVTQFTNIQASSPSLFHKPSRILRRALAAWLGRRTANYEYGTLLSDSDRVIAMCAKHRALLAAAYPELDGKSTMIPPPPIIRMSSDVDSDVRSEVRERLGVGAEESLIAYFGYVYRGKGLETLLEAFAGLSQRRRDVRLILIGGIPDLQGAEAYVAQMRAQVEKMGIAQRVIWTGDFDWESDEASRYLRASDLCVLPFDAGVAMNNSSVAAVCAHGLPIVTTSGEWTDDIFVDGDNVLLCPPRSPAALLAAIESILERPASRDRLRVGALALAQQWFCWESSVHRTVGALWDSRDSVH